MRSDFDNLSETVGAGMLADNVVIAVTRARRGAALAPHHQTALTRALRVLDELASPASPADSDQRSDSQLRRLVDLREQAERVAREGGLSGPLSAYFAAQRDTVATLQQDPGSVDSERVRELIRLFEVLSQSAQRRVNEEVVGMGQPAWMPSQPSGVF
jgi:hypothetical protein